MGIYVEAYDTLFDSHWELKEEVKNHIQDMAEKEDKNVYVITDSDINYVESELSKYDIHWKVISKSDLKGKKLEILISNEPKEHYSKNGISAEEFTDGLGPIGSFHNHIKKHGSNF